MVTAAAEDVPFISLVVPAYNEAGSIAKTVGLITAYLDRQSWAGEVIVSADGDDGTREIVADLARNDGRLRVIGSDERAGKGRGIRNGIAIARGQIIGFVDADYKTPVEELDKLLPWFDQGYDVVFGSRATGDSQIVRAQPLYRRWGSKAFKHVMRAIVGLTDVGDTQCGFKFFRRAAARDLFGLQKIDGYMFDVEVLRLAKLRGWRMKEVGVRWQDDGDSRYNPVTGTIRNARELLRIRLLRYTEGSMLSSVSAEPPHVALGVNTAPSLRTPSATIGPGATGAKMVETASAR